jgi:hypothetical protein
MSSYGNTEITLEIDPAMAGSELGRDLKNRMLDLFYLKGGKPWKIS